MLVDSSNTYYLLIISYSLFALILTDIWPSDIYVNVEEARDEESLEEKTSEA